MDTWALIEFLQELEGVRVRVTRRVNGKAMWSTVCFRGDVITVRQRHQVPIDWQIDDFKLVHARTTWSVSMPKEVYQ